MINDILVLGFVNFMTPESIGSTFITFVMCWNNGVQTVPTSVGLRLVHISPIPVDYVILTGIILQVIVNLLIKRTCDDLDRKDKKEFDPNNRVEQPEINKIEESSKVEQGANKPEEYVQIEDK